MNNIDIARGTDTSVWDWRGQGRLTIATSHWKVWGYEDVPGGPGQWLVIHSTASYDVHERGDQYLFEDEGGKSGSSGTRHLRDFECD